MIICFFDRVLGLTSLSFNPIISIPIIAISIFCISLIIVAGIRKIPVLKKYII